MADKKEPLSAHNPQFEADKIQDRDDENRDVGQVTKLYITQHPLIKKMQKKLPTAYVQCVKNGCQKTVNFLIKMRMLES